jgi:hypothetical protein
MSSLDTTLPKSSSESMCLSEARVSGVAGRAASTSAASEAECEVLLALSCGCECAVLLVVSAFRFLVVDGEGVVAEERAASPMTKQPASGGDGVEGRLWTGEV